MQLLQSRISKFSGGGPPYPHLQERGFREGKPPSRPLIHLILRHSVRAFGTQLSPYFINWDSYFNSFWELWYRNGQVSILFNGLNVTWTRWSASAKSECKFSTEDLQCPAHILCVQTFCKVSKISIDCRISWLHNICTMFLKNDRILKYGNITNHFYNRYIMP